MASLQIRHLRKTTLPLAKVFFKPRSSSVHFFLVLRKENNLFLQPGYRQPPK